MPLPASRAASLQRLMYVLARQRIEQEIAQMLTPYDALQEQIEDALGDWLDALAKGELGQAEVLGRRLRRVLADGLAALPAQEQQAAEDDDEDDDQQ